VTNAKDRTLLIADDDAAFRNRIARALELRGFIVTAVGSVAEALAQTARPPAFAVLDCGLGDGNGLELVGPLRQARPDIRIVVLTGYGNIATAVAAVKEGAIDYLAKPADADAIEQALTAHGRKLPPPPSNRCRPTGCAGSISNASSSSATVTSRRRRGVSTCIAAPCSESWASTRPGSTRPERQTRTPDPALITLQLVLNALALGMAYALVALGFVLALNAAGAVNFAMATWSCWAAPWRSYSPPGPACRASCCCRSWRSRSAWLVCWPRTSRSCRWRDGRPRRPSSRPSPLPP
jgi:two-component system response regulator RegA